MRTWIVGNCLIVGCLFFSSLSYGGNPQQLVPDPPDQTADVQDHSSTDSPDSNGSQATVPVQDAASVSNSQDIASGSTNSTGTASATASGSSSGSTGPSATGAGAVSAYTFPSSGKINRYWLLNTMGPKALVGGVFTASWRTWVSTSPTEWHRDATGWSKRFGVALLDNGINTSVLVTW